MAHRSFVAALALLLGAADLVCAQGVISAPTRLQASLAPGRVRGVVKDDRGTGVGGVMVIALGTTLASVRSDAGGRFNLTVPPGEYILRATRDGYVSTYREAIRVQTSALVERTITIIRQGVAAFAPDPGRLPAVPTPVSSASTLDYGHDEAAWRLRHLLPSVLRDVAPGGAGASGFDGRDGDPLAGGDPRRMGRGDGFRPRGSFLDWAAAESYRAASFLANVDFTGEVNYLATNALAASGAWHPLGWSNGVTSISVGAPVGSRGDWAVRGAMNAGDLSSWVILGEYAARRDRDHVFTAGASYSAQLFGENSALASLTPGESRGVGGLYLADRWRVAARLGVEYDLRFERYDYLIDPNLASLRGGLHARLFGGTTAVVSVGQRMIAPGAEEFLPPPVSGPWLPPDRTFSSLNGTAPFNAERVRTYSAGIEQTFGATDRAAVGVRRFTQSSSDQIATIFGVDALSDSGHYYVATPGSVRVDGWGTRATGRLSSHLRGTLDFVQADATWDRNWRVWGVSRVAPGAVRPRRERIRDLIATIDATIPATSTTIQFACRMDSAFAGTRAVAAPAGFDGRFDLEVHQALPYRPFRGGRLEALVAVRTLFRDANGDAAFYDELLTVAPPLRVMGGVQVRF